MLTDEQCEDLITAVGKEVAKEYGFEAGRALRIFPYRAEGDDRPWDELETKFFNHFRKIHFNHNAGPEAPPDKRYSTASAFVDLREIKKPDNREPAIRYVLQKCRDAALDLKIFLEETKPATA